MLPGDAVFVRTGKRQKEVLVMHSSKGFGTRFISRRPNLGSKNLIHPSMKNPEGKLHSWVAPLATLERFHNLLCRRCFRSCTPAWF
jgi:hypothetical protein